MATAFLPAAKAALQKPDATIHGRPFDNISDRAGDLNWRRNVVTHGYYEIVPGDTLHEDGSRSPKFIATGTIKGKKQSISLETETLEKLWHDIAHLNGRLMATINEMGGWVNNEAEMIIPDIDLLSEQLEGNFRILAKPNKP